VIAPIRRVDEVIAYQNPFITVFDDSVEFAGGNLGRHVRIRSGNGHPGVVVVPYAEGKLALVKVYRYPLLSYQWGFPRGFAHSEDPLITARVELEEELGMSGNLELIGWFTPDSGILESRVAVVLAKSEACVMSPTDTDEVHDVQWIRISALKQKLGSEEYDDGMSMAALALVEAKCHSLQ
jgi:8-oxo-dGTP pyrophosphatase MutT (NUDIX family)